MSWSHAAHFIQRVSTARSRDHGYISRPTPNGFGGDPEERYFEEHQKTLRAELSVKNGIPSLAEHLKLVTLGDWHHLDG